MCGRAYWTISDEEREMRYLNDRWKRNPSPLFNPPNYNMAPTQVVPVAVERDGARQINLMRWGLVPAWSKDLKDAAKYSLINARGEEIDEKRSYKHAFEQRRCIVPLSGFFEWKRNEDGSKRPFEIHLKNEPIMSVAGVWEHWISKVSGEVVDSFSIITTSANKAMATVHDRMPVILDRADEDAWLDPDNQDTVALKKFLVPTRQQLELFEISTLVNSPKHSGPEVLRRV